MDLLINLPALYQATGDLSATLFVLCLGMTKEHIDTVSGLLNRRNTKDAKYINLRVKLFLLHVDKQLSPVN